MTRTGAYKLAYATIVVVGSAGAILLLTTRSAGKFPPALAVLLVAAVLLIPGRVQGALWRDFFRGRRLLAMGRHEASIPFFERFLTRVRSRPGLKHVVWLSWGTYTRDVEAMTENNLGAAKLEVGRWEEAEGHFRRALAVDPRAPLPHYNLALLFAIRGMDQESTRHLAQARELGFTDASSDCLIRSAGELLARVEGRPLPAPEAGRHLPPG